MAPISCQVAVVLENKGKDFSLVKCGTSDSVALGPFQYVNHDYKVDLKPVRRVTG